MSAVRLEPVMSEEEGLAESSPAGRVPSSGVPKTGAHLPVFASTMGPGGANQGARPPPGVRARPEGGPAPTGRARGPAARYIARTMIPTSAAVAPMAWVIAQGSLKRDCRAGGT